LRRRTRAGEYYYIINMSHASSITITSSQAQKITKVLSSCTRYNYTGLRLHSYKMESLQERIAAKSARQIQILTELKAVEHASSALDAHNVYLTDLQKQLSQTQVQLQNAIRIMEKERSDHVHMRDSTMRRFMYAVVGKRENFELKADKEEREYYDALQKKNETKAQVETLENLIKEAIDVRGRLQAAGEKHLALHKELNVLYETVFSGPTPELPEEDAHETATHTAEARYSNMNGELNAVHRAVNCLQQAEKMMMYAINKIDEALRYSTMDIWGVGGRIADIGERNAVSGAQISVSQAQMLVLQAMQQYPGVQPLPPMRLAQGNFMGDILFDNIFSDVNFHHKIGESKGQLVNGMRHLRAQHRAAKSREAELQNQANVALADLESSRKELQEIRERAFLQAERPPPYTEQIIHD